MKKKIAIMLALVILMTAALTACANPQNDDSWSEGEKDPIFASLPDYDFEGTSIDFLANESLYSNARNWFSEDEVETGTIDQAIYERNLRVGASFNVKFTESYEKDVATTTTVVDQMVVAGDDSFDIICIPARYMLDLAAKNYLFDYSSELLNIDLYGDAWIQWVNDIIKINGKTYFAFSDAMLSLYDFTHMMLFNTNVLAQYQIKTSPYDHVEAGTWTYDNMYMMAKNVSSDLDGDGKYTQDDMYGYVCPAYSILANFWVSAGATTVKKLPPQGIFIFDLKGDKHFDSVYRKVFEMFRSTNVWRQPTNDANRYYDEDITFQTNHALFADHTFYSISQLREMESDFGIVPYPKWDDSQAQYYSRVEAGTKTWGVLYIQDPELTGTIIEALALDSHEHLIHTYYDVTLQLKLTRDDKSIDMLDLIRSTMTYDPGDTLFCDEVRNGIFSGVFKNNNQNLSSLLESRSSEVQSMINEKNDYFRFMNGAG